MNTPILTDLEEKEAPWNQKKKTITVNISMSLSNTVEIEVPEDFDEYEASEDTLKDFVREQIILPSELLFKHSQDCWYVDDFCVCL